MSTPFRVVIPARMDSTRLPGKVLLELAGRPVLAHVYDRAMESGASEVVIATDDERIAECGRALGATMCMTSSEHQSGTTRIEEVCRLLGWNSADIVVNLQGDEPLMPAKLIQAAATCLAQQEDCDIATIAAPIVDQDEWTNPNAVKVVCDQQGRALYFSRASIPHPREDASSPPAEALRHIGLYAYRVETLSQYCALPPSQLERIEALEQLRALYGGMTIQVVVTNTAPPPGVDTAEDLEAAARHLAG